MKNQIFATLTLFVILFSSCKDASKINAEEAGEVISDYLKVNQEYKTLRFHFGIIKFNTQKERLELEKYKALENEGYISMNLQKEKKKFLSKDSSFVYLIKLTDKSSDLVLKQDDDKATVKAVIYELDNEKPVNFNRLNNHLAKVTVSLKKTNTVFAPFQKNPKDNSDFITRSYRLKLDKDEGWKVSKN